MELDYCSPEEVAQHCPSGGTECPGHPTNIYRLDSLQDIADKAEAIRYLVKYYHNDKYWSDNNRTHTPELLDCTDSVCIENKEIL